MGKARKKTAATKAGAVHTKHKKAARKPVKKTVKKTAKKTARKVAKKAVRKTRTTAPEPIPTPEPLPEPQGPSDERRATKQPVGRATAEDMARGQREISVAEFFTKNRHLLGFDNPRKALLTTIKEGVDNSLDACEEGGILPEVKVIVAPGSEEDRFRVTIEDNGPGIVKTQIPKIFAKLLYGSKFHRLKMSRGQQGIGISAAGMYGQLTTGKPVSITSKTSRNKPAHHYELEIDTKKNEPRIIVDETIEWPVDRGTKVEIELEAKYQKGRQSVEEYLEQTAIANPHVSLQFVTPEGEVKDYKRATDQLPVETREIKPHPYGVELGVLIKMLHDTKAQTLQSFLHTDFSRVSMRVAKQICEAAKLYERARPARIARQEADNLFKAINHTKIMNPPTDCLSPIGEELILAGLKTQIEADFYTAVTRPPSVYRGNPFQIEAGLAYGGSLEADGLARVLRYANRVPLLYQQSACAMTKSVISTDWRNYALQQANGALPSGPLVILVHMASVWVPFTSESKEAVAHYPEIIKEVRLALQECGRQLAVFIRRRRKAAESEKKKAYIQKYIPHVAIALREMLDLTERQEQTLVAQLTDVLERSRS
ncbi:MAG: DNA topoisomerase VI subunit B [Sedimentisphaerales bacterium]|jgi:DNA topoisomerase-6 subunit B|nr:DNA topoisomerase VI subunit B [Sedimentisphaerales bacterium]HNY79170.1 DNA topoisomerase VI subunit B [Sedimentisphaerales bacterium]HOC64212.1 DNA topoisomerase VI subunit B [Sedimentisphaerales bacterium]HOH65078.1 DNA topoisomerase VI subunit B [Sedimentisphaerales bacterium]HQN34472.1 DNA topoisomerase VI subunit B [Sedimentisphaerales bacterium]